MAGNLADEVFVNPPIAMNKAMAQRYYPTPRGGRFIGQYVGRNLG